MKSQIISMDFVMTFILYIFAVSLFFYGLNNAFFLTSEKKLDIQYELMFNKLNEIYDEEKDFLDGIKIDNNKLDAFFNEDNNVLYDFFFKDLTTNSVKRISYCLYLQDKNNRIIKSRAVFPNYNNNYVYFLTIGERILCGDSDLNNIVANPKCSLKESILIKRNVLYDYNNQKDIYTFNVYICAE
ncbi:MAG: hypothetical protein QXE31_03680 [Candidatus Woesearchaeota archaeon]